MSCHNPMMLRGLNEVSRAKAGKCRVGIPSSETSVHEPSCLVFCRVCNRNPVPGPTSQPPWWGTLLCEFPSTRWQPASSTIHSPDSLGSRKTLELSSPAASTANKETEVQQGVSMIPQIAGGAQAREVRLPLSSWPGSGAMGSSGTLTLVCAGFKPLGHGFQTTHWVAGEV